MFTKIAVAVAATLFVASGTGAFAARGAVPQEVFSRGPVIAPDNAWLDRGASNYDRLMNGSDASTPGGHS